MCAEHRTAEEPVGIEVKMQAIGEKREEIGSKPEGKCMLWL